MMQERFRSGPEGQPQGGEFGVVLPAAGADASLLHVEHSASIAVGDKEAFNRAVKSLGDKVTDYLIVLQISERHTSSLQVKAATTNKLTVYCEGRATIDEVALLFVEALPMLAATCHPVVFSTLRGGTLRRCRQSNPRSPGDPRSAGAGSSGALDEHWVQGQRYRVPLEAVVQSRLGWCPVAETHRPG